MSITFYLLPLFILTVSSWNGAHAAMQRSWPFRIGLLGGIRTRPPPDDACTFEPTEAATLHFCDKLFPRLKRRSCNRRGCCFVPNMKLCLYPRERPSIAVCREGCGNVFIDHGGLDRIWTGPGKYGNNEWTVIEIFGPCYLFVDKMRVEAPTECAYDYIEVMGQRICAPKAAPVTLPPGKHELIWRTDEGVTDGGFTVHLAPVEPEVAVQLEAAALAQQELPEAPVAGTAEEEPSVPQGTEEVKLRRKRGAGGRESVWEPGAAQRQSILLLSPEQAAAGPPEALAAKPGLLPIVVSQSGASGQKGGPSGAKHGVKSAGTTTIVLIVCGLVALVATGAAFYWWAVRSRSEDPLAKISTGYRSDVAGRSPLLASRR